MRLRDEMHHIAETLRRIVAGFIEGIPAAEMFSTDFGIQEGRGLEEWASHEIGEFSRRRRFFGLDPATMGVVVDGVDADGTARFSVTDGSGRVVYRDAWRTDTAGLLVGNGAMFEVVPKLQFDHEGATRRALAVRSPRGRITSVTPVGMPADDCLLDEGMSAENDGFATFSMRLPEDDLKGFTARFRISDAAGVRTTEKVWMQGADDPHFRAGMHPEIDGGRVRVPGVRASWALNVTMRDGGLRSIEHPEPGTYDFPLDVMSAVLTDMLDNDWRTARKD